MMRLKNFSFLLNIILVFSASAKEPSWLNNVNEVCKKSELCAIGMGESRLMAQTTATANLAKIFENKIDAEFSTNMQSDNGEINQGMSERIKESTSVALEGVEHPKMYEGDTHYYALARVKKGKLALKFKSDIDKIDEKVRELYKESGTGVISKIESLLGEREVFGGRYRFLTGINLSPPISYKDFLKRKRELAKGIVVHLWVDEPSPKKIQGYLGDKLASSGYPLTKGKVWKKSATHLLTGKLRTNQEHLKVEGFEKYAFTLTIDSQNRKREKSGSLNILVTETGRNFEQAYEKALVLIKEKIDDQLYKINFRK